MAWVYNQIYPQADEILNVDDWNLMNANLANEFNGYLDRDNIGAVDVGLAQIQVGSFNVVHVDASTSAAPSGTDTETSEWQDGNTNAIGELEIDCPVDCRLICEFGCRFEPDSADTRCVRFRILVDGEIVGMSGWLATDWVEFGLWDGTRIENWSVHIAGVIGVLSGIHTVKAQVQVAMPNVNKQGWEVVENNDGVTIYARELVVIEGRR